MRLETVNVTSEIASHSCCTAIYWYYHSPESLFASYTSHHSTNTITSVFSAHGLPVWFNWLRHLYSFSFFMFQKTVRNPYVDIFVAIITVPTLILLALLLDANIQENFSGADGDSSTKSSFIVLIFGFGFLVLSLLVCGCIMHKMGMCLWTKTTYTDNDDQSTNGNATSGGHRGSNSSGSSRRANECFHIIDMPPSYETIINGYKCDLVATDAVPSLARMPEMSAAAPPPTYESLGLGLGPESRAGHDMPSGATSNHIWCHVCVATHRTSRYNF